MPIYRCNQCSFVSEDPVTPVGTKVACGRCGNLSMVYGTVFYVEKIVERYVSALREVAALQQSDKPAAQEDAAQAVAQSTPTSAPALAGINASNTTLLATAEQHAPLSAWFSTRQIEARFDYGSVDTSGFFDDAACMLGEGYELYAELIDRVCFAYRKGHSSIYLELGKLSQKDGQALNTLCRKLYSHTFFSRYQYQKQEKIVRLTLQTAPAIRQFFDGGWLEWYAFMELLTHLQQRDLAVSYARGVKVVFANEDLHELDVIALPDGKSPICIECKSGEFRRDIEKYLRLSKRLGISRNRFIICATDLTDEQAVGLTKMYELTFVNTSSLKQHLDTLV